AAPLLVGPLPNSRARAPRGKSRGVQSRLDRLFEVGTPGRPGKPGARRQEIVFFSTIRLRKLSMARKLNNDRAIRIASAAKQEFAKRGFAGARVERIARTAGVNKQLLFYYFHSKRGLFQAAVRRAMSELETALGSSAQLSGRP